MFSHVRGWPSIVTSGTPLFPASLTVYLFLPTWAKCSLGSESTGLEYPSQAHKLALTNPVEPSGFRPLLRNSCHSPRQLACHSDGSITWVKPTHPSASHIREIDPPPTAEKCPRQTPVASDSPRSIRRSPRTTQMLISSLSMDWIQSLQIRGNGGIRTAVSQSTGSAMPACFRPTQELLEYLRATGRQTFSKVRSPLPSRSGNTDGSY